MLLLQFVLERVIIHAFDGFFMGVGYYLIRYTTKKAWGWTLLLIYALSLAGLAMDDPQSVAEALWGLPYIALAELIGRWVEKRQTRPQNETSGGS